MSAANDIMAHDAQLLAVSAGKMEGRTKAILTFRLFPDASFASANIAISKEQTIRLRDDLNFILDNYPSMKTVEDVDEPDADPDNPPDTPRRPRKRRGK